MPMKSLKTLFKDVRLLQTSLKLYSDGDQISPIRSISSSLPLERRLRAKPSNDPNFASEAISQADTRTCWP
jgi:hypothetical protein